MLYTVIYTLHLCITSVKHCKALSALDTVMCALYCALHILTFLDQGYHQVRSFLRKTNNGQCSFVHEGVGKGKGGDRDGSKGSGGLVFSSCAPSEMCPQTGSKQLVIYD